MCFAAHPPFSILRSNIKGYSPCPDDEVHLVPHLGLHEVQDRGDQVQGGVALVVTEAAVRSNQ